MTTVWLLERGEYSDREVVGVFSSREKAEVVAKAINASEGNYYNCHEPHEWVLDSLYTPLSQGLLSYYVRIEFDGTVLDVEPRGIADRDLYEIPRMNKRTLVISVWARNKEHAVKIANERRIQWRVKEGI